jgi:GTPase
MLAKLPKLEAKLQTSALNQQVKTKSTVDSARLDEYEIVPDLAEHRTWYVYGEALERFAQMTNWDYFEAVLRFQRVLKSCGLWKSLKVRGVMEGDTVVIGDVEFAWADDQNDGKMYEAWIDDLNARGRVGKGSARWPHMAG